MGDRTVFRRRASVAVTAIVAILAIPSWATAQDSAELGKEVYDRWCAGCHGVDGAADGAAAGYMLPRPRDFTLGLYQIRSTASGQLPTDDDIMRIIDEGMPGSAMPGWEELLSTDEREALVEYLKSFSRFFANSPAPEPLDFGSPPRVSEAGLAEGREWFETIECWKCHGQEGRGDGESSPTLADDLDLPIRAADLTENWTFNGGGRVEDIYQRMRTGLDGTPMPSNSDLIDAGVLTEEQLWNVAHYVRSMSPDEPPPITEVITAGLQEPGTLPTTTDDPIWEEAQRFYVPMVGQIIVRPRWFDPRVDGLWVQALHDGDEVALRLSWSDPSQSPDSAWAPWKERITSIMEPDDGVPFDEGPLPDQLAIQFPVEVPDGMERPYFLLGDGRDPVYLWVWRSDQDGVQEGNARGMGTMDIQPPEQQALTGQATFDNGEWQLLVRRTLAAGEPETDVSFPIDQAVPVGFFAWDGDNGESGNRAAISSWYFLLLEGETGPQVIVAPLAAMLLTAVLGIGVVGRAQKRERAGAGDDVDTVEAAQGTA